MGQFLDQPSPGAPRLSICPGFGIVLWVVSSGAGRCFRCVRLEPQTWEDFGKGGLLMESELRRSSHASTASLAGATRRSAECSGRRCPEDPPRRAAARRRGGARPTHRAADRPELRGEIRSLVIARNARRGRRGKPPLDVDAEVERESGSSGTSRERAFASRVSGWAAPPWQTHADSSWTSWSTVQGRRSTPDRGARRRDDSPDLVRTSTSSSTTAPTGYRSPTRFRSTKPAATNCSRPSRSLRPSAAAKRHRRGVRRGRGGRRSGVGPLDAGLSPRRSAAARTAASSTRPRGRLRCTGVA